jgi:hypothetical protein
MKLRTLRARPVEIDEADVRGCRGTLRVVEGSTQIIEWPYAPVSAAPDEATASGAARHVVVKAEVQTKRFSERDVDTERYSATVLAGDNSPYSILSALLEACGRIEDFHIAGAPNDQIILQISLRG